MGMGTHTARWRRAAWSTIWLALWAVPAGGAGLALGYAAGLRDAERERDGARDAAVERCAQTNRIPVMIVDAADRSKDAWRCVGGSNRSAPLQ
jgi:uncharacterized membrane protein